MSIANPSDFAFPNSDSAFATNAGWELTDAELQAVSGGSDNYQNALTIAVGFATGAAATVAMPAVAGAFALGSIGASAIAIFSALTDEDNKNKQ